MYRPSQARVPLSDAIVDGYP
ncbi:hypothetical protein DESC_940102 [Desulfosarcina cetonica]|nr:hypothetical protein DESC_940102 [Desulfosarcina cetonica]